MDIPVYMLPALHGPTVFVPHIIRVCPSDRWLYASAFICIDRVHCVWVFFIPADCLFVFLFLVCTVILCFISVLGSGVFDRWWGGGSHSPVLAVFSGWSP